MAFVGPHHGPKILGKNHQSTTKLTLNEPPIMTKLTNYIVTKGITNLTTDTFQALVMRSTFSFTSGQTKCISGNYPNFGLRVTIH